MAVAVGIILAAFVNARALETEQLKGIALHDGNNRAEGAELDAEHAAKLREAAGAILLTRLRGAFSYASAREFARRVAQHLPDYRLVIYDFTEVGYVDPSAAVAIDDLFTQAIADGQTVLVAGLSGRVQQTLEGFGVLDDIPPGHRYDSRAEAIDAALELWRKTVGPGAGASAGGVAEQPS